MNRRQRHKAWLAKQTPQEPIYDEGVGLVLGVMRHNHTPKLPANQAWARAVPKQQRRAGKPITIK